jgi:methylmalonyl-CoA/ethylmalonyl-CoA epimerase
MKAGLNHIRIVIHDVEEVVKLLRTLGIKPLTKPEPDPIQKVTGCFCFRERTGIHIELQEPTDNTSPVANFLARRGGGLHHLCFEADDIDSAARKLET